MVDSAEFISVMFAIFSLAMVPFRISKALIVLSVEVKLASSVCC